VSGATVWVGLRGYSNAASTGTTKAVKLRRDSDNTTSDFFILNNGSLDVASVALFAGVANLFVDTLYDQTGNANHLVQATLAKQPNLVLGGFGTLPCMTFNGTQWMQNTTAALLDGFSASAVTEREIAGRGAQNIIFSFDISAIMGFQASNDTIFIGNEEVFGTGADGVWHAIQSVNTAPGGADMTLNIDGVVTHGPHGFGTNITGFSVGIYVDFFSGPLNGKLAELGTWQTEFSSSDQNSIRANQAAYWGI
jgi:hypothetical protein